MKATEAKPWLKYFYPEDLEMVMPEMSVMDFLIWRGKDRMHIPAINYYDKVLDLQEVFDKIFETANAYAALGVKRGDIVMVCAPTTPETIYTFYGLSLLGAVSNMVDPRYNANGMHEFIKEMDSKFVMCIDVAYDKIKEAVKDTSVEKVVIIVNLNTLLGGGEVLEYSLDSEMELF